MIHLKLVLSQKGNGMNDIRYISLDELKRTEFTVQFDVTNYSPWNYGMWFSGKYQVTGKN